MPAKLKKIGEKKSRVTKLKRRIGRGRRKKGLDRAVPSTKRKQKREMREKRISMTSEETPVQEAD